MKLAVCISPDDKDCLAIVKRMAVSQQIPGLHSVEIFGHESHAIACIRTSERFSKVDLLRFDEKSGNLLAVAGVPISMSGDLEKRLGEIVREESKPATGLLANLDGGFNALHWDRANNIIAIITDPLGAQPLYCAQVGSCLLFASELKAFSSSGLLEVQMDRVGWGSFLSLGFNAGKRTQLTGVNRVDAATVVSVNLHDGSTESSCYWHWPSSEDEPPLEDVDVESLLHVVEDEVHAYHAHFPNATLLFSGGFDSRFLMGALCRAGIHASALTVVNQDELCGVEGSLATRAAKKLNGGDSTLVYPSSQYFDSPGYLKYLAMNEVSIPSLGLFIAKVWQFLHPQIGAVWEGVFPGYGFAPPFPHPGGFSEYRRHRVKPLSSLNWQVALRTFGKEISIGMHEEFDAALQKEMDEYSDDEFGVNEFQINNQMRRRLGASPYKVFANFVMPFTPCVSKKYWETAARIPFAIRGDKSFYMQVLQQYPCELMKIPVCSGGKFYSQTFLPPSLHTIAKYSSVRSQFKYYRQRFSDKMGNRLPGIWRESCGGSNPLVNGVIQSIQPDHPELNAEMVVAVQKAQEKSAWDIRLARSLLFYWQTWHWVMDGRLKTDSAGALHDDLMKI